jgi:hypothetical protein
VCLSVRTLPSIHRFRPWPFCANNIDSRGDAICSLFLLICAEFSTCGLDGQCIEYQVCRASQPPHHQHWWGAFRAPTVYATVGMSEVLNGEAQWRGDGHPLINHEITTATGRAAVIKGVRQAPGGTGLQFLLVFSDQDYIVMDENTLRMAIHTRQVGPTQASAVDPSRGQDGAPAASAAMHPPSAGDLLARVKPEPQPIPEATPQVR